MRWRRGDRVCRCRRASAGTWCRSHPVRSAPEDGSGSAWSGGGAVQGVPAAAPAALKGSLGYLRTRFQKLPAAPAVSRRPSRGRYPEPCRHALCESGHQEPRGSTSEGLTRVSGRAPFHHPRRPALHTSDAVSSGHGQAGILRLSGRAQSRARQYLPGYAGGNRRHPAFPRASCSLLP